MADGIDTSPSTVATSALQSIPFQALIGGPLDAAIQAQAMAAQTSWEFIKQVGLNTDPTTGQMTAVNVSFSYTSKGQTVALNVPLLTIVPIPYIAIDTINIDFKANISASASSVSTTSDSTDVSGGGSATASLGYGPFSVSAQFQANYSSKKDSTATKESKYSVEYTMDVSVAASQSAMPAGLASVLNILQSSINATPLNAAGQFLFNVPPVTSGMTSFPITVNITDASNLPVANQVLSITQPDASSLPAGLTIAVPAAADMPSTDAFGSATIPITVSFDSSYTVGATVPFTVTVPNVPALQGTINAIFQNPPAQ